MPGSSKRPEISHGATSERWWEQTKRDPRKLAAWLRDQYRGEATAAQRIGWLRRRFAAEGSRAGRVLGIIAEQERQHAQWVAELLRVRGIEPVVEQTPERYWPQVMGGIDSLSTGCAVGAHAERMRLERIETIAADPEAPEDIRRVFARILPQERFHERAFRRLSSPGALEATRHAHELGRTALGLHP